MTLAYYISVMSPLRINQSCLSCVIKQEPKNTYNTISISISHLGPIHRGCQILRDGVPESGGSEMESLIDSAALFSV